MLDLRQYRDRYLACGFQILFALYALARPLYPGHAPDLRSSDAYARDRHAPIVAVVGHWTRDRCLP